jgi:hypothetical protein
VLDAARVRPSKSRAGELSDQQSGIVPGHSLCGAPPGTRTPNPLIKSQLLCQLS